MASPIKFKSKKLDELVPYVNNSRTHSEAQIAQIAASIQEFGFTNPVLIGDDNVLIAGHGRVLAARKLRLKEVPCMVISGLTEIQRKALVLADNRLALSAGWDADMLKLEMQALMDDGYNLELTGFDEDEIAKLLDAGGTEGLTDPDAVPELPEEPITKTGDIWQIGGHRLMCGDSSSQTQLDLLLNGGIAQLCITDPPYNMAAEGGSKQPIGRAAAKLGEAIKHLCDFEPEQFLAMLPTIFDKGIMNSYVFCNKDLVPNYLKWAVEAGYNFNILFWKKPNAIPLGGQHRPDVEYILFFRKSAKWNNAVKDANYSKCLEYAREKEDGHPTIKPIKLIQNMMMISSSPGQLIFEPFSGSGTTIIAAEMLGRICYAMEISPAYVDVAVKRWENFTGKKAVLENGKENTEGKTETKARKTKARN